MIGIELNFPGKPVVMEMLEQFVISNVTMDTTIRLVPPLVITYDQIDRFVDVFVNVLEKHEK
jgi:acetylornithine/succinyldiaminopimelate/putrescine aminotransferase